MTVTVLIVDDHPVVREGMRGMLVGEPDIEVVGEAGDGAEAAVLANSLKPDVVLMDLRMPGTDGVEATKRIVGASEPGHGPAVVVVTTYDTDLDILRAVEAGARGYLLKDTPRADLIRAIRAAAGGATVLAPLVAAKLLGRGNAPAHQELTARELEVLGLVAIGKTNSEIGEALYIGEATVKTHLLHAFAKLGVDDRTAAVTTAIARGLLPAPN
ncbi:MAG TPA: response regulator transcription factor [Acidimicrobiales bacterium]|nr:response regulator transcription factor [Acidimicrobiales bacterium]